MADNPLRGRFELEDYNQDKPEGPKPISRRKFLEGAGLVLGGALLGGVVGGLAKKTPKPMAPPQAPAQPANFNRALMYLTQAQFAIVDAATERIFPADEHGPGARDLGVAFYIDHQLAGDWGFNARDYMSPPFYTGEKVQGYQGRLKRREIFDIGLREVENFSMTQYSKGFASLAPEQQDAVLTAFQTDKANVTTISASGFFNMLRGSTLEGVYSDPLYGGNANMDGWKMRSYPGNQMTYADIIDKEFAKIAPTSLQQHMTSH